MAFFRRTRLRKRAKKLPHNKRIKLPEPGGFYAEMAVWLWKYGEKALILQSLPQNINGISSGAKLIYWKSTVSEDIFKFK
jgi:hypothetical protein